MKNPFRPVDPIQRLRQQGDQPGGWLERLSKQAETVTDGVAGLKARLDKRFKYGEPACTKNERIFNADTASTFNFTTDMVSGSPITVNYVIKDAITYEIPVIFPPPGVFEARYFNIQVLMNMPSASTSWGARLGTGYVAMTYPQASKDVYTYNETPKFWIDNSDTDAAVQPPSCAFLWNIVDMKSGMRLSDEMLPDQLLLPPFNAGSDVVTSCNMLGNYEFDVPWLFERDAQVTVLFRPITPVLQASGETRIAKVITEFHGTRWFTSQDEMRLGARI